MVLLGLKKRLQNCEKDILYYRRQRHDHGIRVEDLCSEIQDLKAKLRKLKQENSEYEMILLICDG